MDGAMDDQNTRVDKHTSRFDWWTEICARTRAKFHLRSNYVSPNKYSRKSSSSDFVDGGDWLLLADLEQKSQHLKYTVWVCVCVCFMFIIGPDRFQVTIAGSKLKKKMYTSV